MYDDLIFSDIDDDTNSNVELSAEGSFSQLIVSSDAGSNQPYQPYHPYHLQNDISNGFSGRVAASDGDQNSQINFGASVHSEVAYAGTQLDSGISVLQQFRNTVFPRTKNERINKALDWRSEDDLISGLIDLKVDALIAGFKLNCQPEKNELEDIGSSDSDSDSSNNDNSSNNDKNGIIKSDSSTEIDDTEVDQDVVDQTEFQVLLSKIKRRFDLRSIVRQLADDYFTTDSMIFYWKIDPKQVSQMKSADDSSPILEDGEELIPGLVDVNSISPLDVDWDDSFGRDILKVKIPAEVKNKINDALRDSVRGKEKLQALIESGIPIRVIEAVQNGEDSYELDREEGDNWIIKTKNRKHHGLAHPSMLPVFLSLEIRKNLKEGEFAAAFRMKHFIFHATCGESIESGSMAGLTTNWASKKDTKNLLGLLKGTNKTTLAATNHTVKFAFIFPPVEMFSPEKYIKHEQIIYYWSGVNVVLYTGEGGKYASGYIGIKRLASQISNVRNLCSDVITEFFDHVSIKEEISVPEDCIVVATYDENSLKEPKQLLDEIKTMFENGMGDPVTAISELGRNPSTIRRSKLASMKDNEETGVWKNMNDASLQEGEEDAGRPPNEGTVQNEDTRTQRPVSS